MIEKIHVSTSHATNGTDARQTFCRKCSHKTCNVLCRHESHGNCSAAVKPHVSSYNTHTRVRAHTRARVRARSISIALVGNPNSGKTTLYNSLTGSTLKTGNRSGVTVETKVGKAKLFPDVIVADTPGIYDITPYSPEESETTRYLSDANPYIIVNVVDCTCLARSLALTLKLATSDTNTVLALNMADEAAKNGLSIDAEKLSRLIGLPCIFVSATNKADCERLLEMCIDIACDRSTTFPNNAGSARNGQTAPCGKQSSRAESNGSMPDFDDDKTHLIAEQIAKQCTSSTTRSRNITEKIDDVVLNRWFALPLFAFAMWLTFWISVQGPGHWLSAPVTDTLTPLIKTAVRGFLSQTNCSWLLSLVTDGVVGGIMSVVGFTPQVTLITACMALMEESGYLARVAFVTDRLLRPLGLSGKSVICLTIGCGCSVPAILSARTITCPQQRRSTVGLIPFVPCSAKTAVIGYFSSIFFDGNALVALSLYLATALAVLPCGLILKILNGKTIREEPFAVELPPYRKPFAKCVWRQTANAAKAFLTRAGTTIFVTSVALWLLQNFDFSLRLTAPTNGILAQMGRFLSPLFAPLGFDDGGCGEIYSVAALSGLTAKETILTTLAVLGNGNVPSITPTGAYCFVLYNLLTVPCLATISTSISEQGGKNAAISLSLQAVFAYVVTASFHCLVS